MRGYQLACQFLASYLTYETLNAYYSSYDGQLAVILKNILR